ncbi:GGDEF domain-containing protein [Vibrio profundi]|uniref:GGDEF domain-containing protein n=1 Tax=Vibrio profundi TaxID=1774960 RepID=UPI0037363A39
MSCEILDSTDRIRATVLSAVSFFFMFIVSMLAIFNVVYHSQYLFAALEMLFALFSLYVFVQCRRNRYSVRVAYWYLLCIASLILLGTALLPITDILFLWGLFYPTITYLLLGKRLGFQMSLIVFVLLVSATCYQVLFSGGLPLEPVLVNLVTCFLGIWCVSHYFELSRAQGHESLAKLALTDSLTGCNNRLAFNRTFNDYRDDFLLMIDIDNFKSINDEYGHDVGDQALKMISERLKNEAANHRIFRIGGEEFCVWLTASNMDDALGKANDLRSRITQFPLNAGGEKVHLSFSGGLVKNRLGLTEDEVLKRADTLMYQAKEQGKDRVLQCSDSTDIPSALAV